jgi:hypothetical protein
MAIGRDETSGFDPNDGKVCMRGVAFDYNADQ